MKIGNLCQMKVIVTLDLFCAVHGILTHHAASDFMHELNN